MNARFVFQSAVLLSLVIPAPAIVADEPITLGSRRELFVDYQLIANMHNVRLSLNRPHDEGVVLRFDNPWEGGFCGYCTVIKDEDRYRLYYRGLPQAGADGSPEESCCYAESSDGIHWVKPEFELFEIHGAKKNNAILANAAPFTHNFSPLLDTNPDANPEQRFKALGGTMKSGLVAWTSPDGIHWTKLRDEAVINVDMVPFTYMFDSQNLAFWSANEGKYLCYFRVFKDGVRRIARSTSDNFTDWSAPVLMEYTTNGQPSPIEHLYTNQTSPYFRAPHIYVSVAARFMPGRQVLTDEQALAINVNPKYFKDTSDAVLMTSRGGGTYDRTFLSSFVRPGIGANNWVSRTNYPALNIVQTGPTEMSVYVNQDYAQPTAHLRRYSMRIDGFASATADYDGGELLTKPFTFSGNQLSINFATSAAGSVKFELQTPDGGLVPGFSAADCQAQIGNEIERIVTWKSGSDVSSLVGQTVKMRIVLRDADLYSFQFKE